MSILILVLHNFSLFPHSLLFLVIHFPVCTFPSPLSPPRPLPFSLPLSFYLLIYLSLSFFLVNFYIERKSDQDIYL